MEAGLQSLSLVHVDGALLQMPQMGRSVAMQTRGLPHVESSLQHIGCGQPSCGHWNSGDVFRRHWANMGRHEHWKQKSGVHRAFARQSETPRPRQGSA